MRSKIRKICDFALFRAKNRVCTKVQNAKNAENRRAISAHAVSPATRPPARARARENGGAANPPKTAHFFLVGLRCDFKGVKRSFYTLKSTLDPPGKNGGFWPFLGLKIDPKNDSKTSQARLKRGRLSSSQRQDTELAALAASSFAHCTQPVHKGTPASW